MAYNPYNPYYAPPQYPEPPKQIQYSVVNAPSVDYAKSYPVAPGNSVSFKIENQPFLCTKTMGFSPLEKPVFETYRLVKEDEAEIADDKPEYVLKEELVAIESRLAEIEKSLKPRRRKTEEPENE
jgi:hypothetical protein